MESARADLAQRITAVTPKTSAAATDIVHILTAIQGAPTSVQITSPTTSGRSGYDNNTSSSWIIQIEYGAEPVTAGEQQ